jgi:hypothetical protein
MMATRYAILAACVILLLAGAHVASAQGTDPGSVVRAFDEALNAGNVEATLALFAPDAVVRTQNQTYTGTAQLRSLFMELVAQNINFDSGDHRVSGDTETHTATVSRDDWRRLGLAWLDATASVVVQGGKIRSFTVTYSPDSTARLQQAQARAQPSPAPAQMPTALPRTGEAPLAVGRLVWIGAASLAAGLTLLRRR